MHARRSALPPDIGGAGRVASLAVALVLAASFTTSSVPARAQTRETEAELYRRHRHDAAEHYGVGISLLVSAALGAAYGFPRLVTGDVYNVDGALALGGAGAMAGLSLGVFALAAGLDVGATLWNAAMTRRAGRGPETAESSRAERRDLGHAIMALYVSGLAMAAVGGACALGVAKIEEGLRSVPGWPFDRALYVPPFVVGGIGVLAFLFAVGLDVSAGVWSGGAGAWIAVVPSTTGAAVVAIGSF